MTNQSFYKFEGFWWTYKIFLGEEPGPTEIDGPYCLNCQTDLEFPGSAYVQENPDGGWMLNSEWNGVLICPLCDKKHKWEGKELMNLKKKISMLLISTYRTKLAKISLEEPITNVKVRDEDDIYFLAAKIGQKEGKRIGVVYFGEKTKDQNKMDYSQIFIDLDDEQVRFDKNNKHPKEILAKFKVEFPGTISISEFKRRNH